MELEDSVNVYGLPFSVNKHKRFEVPPREMLLNTTVALKKYGTFAPKGFGEERKRREKEKAEEERRKLSSEPLERVRKKTREDELREEREEALVQLEEQEAVPRLRILPVLGPEQRPGTTTPLAAAAAGSTRPAAAEPLFGFRVRVRSLDLKLSGSWHS